MQRCARRPSGRPAARPATRCVAVRCAPRSAPPLRPAPTIRRPSALLLLRPMLLRKSYSTTPEPPPRAAIVREKAGDTTRTFHLRDDMRELSFTVEPRERKHSKDGVRARVERGLRHFFLPVGYPDTVSSDYWPFHRWWILSSLAGSANYVLSMQCLLTAVGMPVIGSIPISASISWVLKDGLGSLMSMFVAGRFARGFDAEPKTSKWRADILHNVGIAIEILTPLVPAYFLLMASLANTLKGVAGLVAGATRASFNRGFAISDNLGEVTAKAQGQGIAAYLVGMGLGIGLSFLWPIQELAYTFPLFAFLAAVHLTAGYQSLCNVTVTSLNLQRAFLLIQQYVRAAAQQAVMARIETPDDLRLRERFVSGTEPWRPAIQFGASFLQAFTSAPAALAALRMFAEKRYVVALAGDGSGRINVLLKKEAEAKDVLEAIFYAVVLVHQQPDARTRKEEHIRAAQPFVAERFPAFFAQLLTSQWKDSHGLVHAVGKNRISITEQPDPPPPPPPPLPPPASSPPPPSSTPPSSASAALPPSTPPATLPLPPAAPSSSPPPLASSPPLSASPPPSTPPASSSSSSAPPPTKSDSPAPSAPINQAPSANAPPATRGSASRPQS